jgi:hypothetical protein
MIQLVGTVTRVCNALLHRCSILTPSNDVSLSIITMDLHSISTSELKGTTHCPLRSAERQTFLTIFIRKLDGVEAEKDSDLFYTQLTRT